MRNNFPGIDFPEVPGIGDVQPIAGVGLSGGAIQFIDPQTLSPELLQSNPEPTDAGAQLDIAEARFPGIRGSAPDRSYLDLATSNDPSSSRGNPK
jgi:hypothetical protein